MAPRTRGLACMYYTWPSLYVLHMANLPNEKLQMPLTEYWCGYLKAMSLYTIASEVEGPRLVQL